MRTNSRVIRYKISGHTIKNHSSNQQGIYQIVNTSIKRPVCGATTLRSDSDLIELQIDYRSKLKSNLEFLSKKQASETAESSNDAG